MLFSNLNEINAELNNYQMKRAAAKKMERLALITIILAVITIVMLVVWLFRHKKMRQRLLEKNDELKTALRMAEESDRMKTEFVRQVSHEIRTPLNAINGFNEILNNPEMELSDEERQDLVARIKQNTKAITDIVEEMLYLSERESNNIYEKKDHMPCNKVLSELLYRNRSQVSSAVELIYTSEVINRFTILTNEDFVTKIVDQLVQNAIKFTTRGTITMNCRTINDDTTLEISVTDTGRGIKPELRQQIFEQFVKEDHFQQGMGLGLTVSRKIAQKLGGDLTLDESYNEGARFILTLPVE
jgi:signal transduction histidine kinase